MHVVECLSTSHSESAYFTEWVRLPCTAGPPTLHSPPNLPTGSAYLTEWVCLPHMVSLPTLQSGSAYLTTTVIVAVPVVVGVPGVSNVMPPSKNACVTLKDTKVKRFMFVSTSKLLLFYFILISFHRLCKFCILQTFYFIVT